MGTRVLDYLLLTQQVWSNPALSPKLLGGTTTQNTDAEWSDARQGYVAVLLFDYYQATKNTEYLERAVAAARSTFAVAPWENWAHTGFKDQHGALTGFHWAVSYTHLCSRRSHRSQGSAVQSGHRRIPGIGGRRSNHRMRVRENAGRAVIPRIAGGRSQGAEVRIGIEADGRRRGSLPEGW